MYHQSRPSYPNANTRQAGRLGPLKLSRRPPRRGGHSISKTATSILHKPVTHGNTTINPDRRGPIHPPAQPVQIHSWAQPLREVHDRGTGLCTPPSSSASSSDAGTRSVIVVSPPFMDHLPVVDNPPLDTPPDDTPRDDDDVASQGSMTTWVGEMDGENLPTAPRTPGTVLFDYDPNDSKSDKPPIPWEQVQSYTDFRDNKEAHAYWKWDPDMVMWKHVDPDTQEAVFCPSELD